MRQAKKIYNEVAQCVNKAMYRYGVTHQGIMNDCRNNKVDPEIGWIVAYDSSDPIQAPRRMMVGMAINSRVDEEMVKRNLEKRHVWDKIEFHEELPKLKRLDHLGLFDAETQPKLYGSHKVTIH